MLLVDDRAAVVFDGPSHRLGDGAHAAAWSGYSAGMAPREFDHSQCRPWLIQAGLRLHREERHQGAHFGRVERFVDIPPCRHEGDSCHFRGIHRRQELAGCYQRADRACGMRWGLAEAAPERAPRSGSGTLRARPSPREDAGPRVALGQYLVKPAPQPVIAAIGIGVLRRDAVRCSRRSSRRFDR